MRHRWTDPNVQAELAAKSAMGMSAAQIAEDIGCTRSAVAGAMSRYGLFADSQPERESVTLATMYRSRTVH